MVSLLKAAEISGSECRPTLVVVEVEVSRARRSNIKLESFMGDLSRTGTGYHIDEI